MMSAANDWTVEIEKKGLPELKKLYTMLGVPDLVNARCHPEFGHNYNQVSREMMYSWFNKHLLGKTGDVKEEPFKPIPPKDLSVYDAKHPRPADELNAKKLREKMTEASEAQMKALEPNDAKSLAEYRHVVGTALKVMIGGGLPKPGKLKIHMAPKEVKLADGVTMHITALGREGEGDMVPAAGVFKGKFDAGVVVWIDPRGKSSLIERGKLVPAAAALVDKGYAIVAPDVFNTGELTGSWAVQVRQGKETVVVKQSEYPVNKGFAGFTYGYNRPVFANRVHDILTAVAFARDVLKAKTIHLVGWEGAGPWSLLPVHYAATLLSEQPST